ncbi:MAG: LysR family transcriptional regulator [Dehalococcoidales bacterium]|nr:LysR family transcriptional regulator [Dehalococcoidales bacterium]
MNLDYLRTFIEVSKQGSFSEVARKLSISQPAVSFQIQRLEQELGVRLIDRRQKTLALTEEGKRFLAFAGQCDRDYQYMAHDLEQMKEEITGNLSIAASTIPGDFILPTVLSEFKRRHPSVNIQVAITDSVNVIEAVKSEKYDIGFCGMPPESQDLIAMKVAEDEIVLIVFPGHPFAARESISIQEIIDEPLIFREPTSGTHRNVKALLLNAGFDLDQCRPALVLGTTESIITAVEAGSGIAFVSNMAIKKSLALGLVRSVAIKELNLKRNFWCVYRKQMLTSRLIDEFVAFVREK